VIRSGTGGRPGPGGGGRPAGLPPSFRWASPRAPPIPPS